MEKKIHSFEYIAVLEPRNEGAGWDLVKLRMPCSLSKFRDLIVYDRCVKH